MNIPPFLPFYEFSLRLPQPGAETALFAFFVLLGALTLLYALPDRRPGTLIAMLLHAGGGLLALTAQDLIVLLLGWETMTFTAFFLLARTGRENALSAGLRYIVIHMASATLFFIGAAVHWQATGALAVAPATPAAQPFFLAAILIKTAMIPMHAWLIDTYPKASYAGSVLFSIYTTKVGVFTAARLLRVSLFDQPVLALVGATVAVLAVIGALRQRNARRLLAWHIVSQIGFMLAGVGLAVSMAGGRLGVEAGLFHAVNHIVYKSALLMVAGAVCRQFGHDDLHRMGGAGRGMPVTFAVAVVASLAIVGVPPFAGYASKELLKQASQTPLIPGLLLVASVGTGLSFIKFIALIFLKKPAPGCDLPLKDPPALQRIPMLILAAFCLINGLRPGWILSGTDIDIYTPSAVIFGLIPPLAAGLIWLGIRRRVLSVPDSAEPEPVVWPEAVGNRLSPLLPRLRAWHAVHPHTAFMALFLFWIALAYWLGNA